MLRMALLSAMWVWLGLRILTVVLLFLYAMACSRGDYRATLLCIVGLRSFVMFSVVRVCALVGGLVRLSRLLRLCLTRLALILFW